MDRYRLKEVNNSVWFVEETIYMETVVNKLVTK